MSENVKAVNSDPDDGEPADFRRLLDYVSLYKMYLDESYNAKKEIYKIAKMVGMRADEDLADLICNIAPSDKSMVSELPKKKRRGGYKFTSIDRVKAILAKARKNKRKVNLKELSRNQGVPYWKVYEIAKS